MILVPIESAYVTFYCSVIVTLVLSCTVSEIRQVLCALTPLILGVFTLHQIVHVGRQRAHMGLKLFGREIIFEEFQPI